MSDDADAPFLFPAVGRKKAIADFDGGRLTPDGGVMLLRLANPNAQHLQTEITMKQAHRRTVSAAQLAE